MAGNYEAGLVGFLIRGSTLAVRVADYVTMYRYSVIAVGKMKNRSLAALCEDFAKRLKRQGL